MTTRQKIRKESARKLLTAQLAVISKYLIAKKCEFESDTYCTYIHIKYDDDEKRLQKLITLKGKELTNLNRKLNYG